MGRTHHTKMGPWHPSMLKWCRCTWAWCWVAKVWNVSKWLENCSLVSVNHSENAWMGGSLWLDEPLCVREIQDMWSGRHGLCCEHGIKGTLVRRAWFEGCEHLWRSWGAEGRTFQVPGGLEQNPPTLVMLSLWITPCTKVQCLWRMFLFSELHLETAMVWLLWILCRRSHCWALAPPTSTGPLIRTNASLALPVGASSSQQVGDTSQSGWAWKQPFPLLPAAFEISLKCMPGCEVRRMCVGPIRDTWLTAC